MRQMYKIYCHTCCSWFHSKSIWLLKWRYHHHKCVPMEKQTKLAEDKASFCRLTQDLHAYKEKYTKHIRVSHVQEPYPLECKICGAVNNRVCNMVQHVLNEHFVSSD